MNKSILTLFLALGLAACSKDTVYFNNTYTVKVPVDVTAQTKAVISEDAITVTTASLATWSVYASNAEECKQISDAKYGDQTYTSQPWVDDPTTMYVLGINPKMTNANSYYESKIGGSYKFENGKIVATAAAVDGSYFKPMSVAFYGIYDASISTVADTTSLKDASSAYEGTGKTQKLSYTLSWADSSKKAQYTVAGFAPTFSVAENIIVKTSATDTKTVKATDYPFTIQYIYVGSGTTVTYGANYEYTVSGAGVTKLGLPQGGVFAGTTLKTVGGIQDYVWKSFKTNTSTFMTLLPTNSNSVEVTLCCWNCGTKTIYTKSGKAIYPGGWFYIQGTLTKGTKVENKTNPDCEDANESSALAVFMPDVLTKVDIKINTLANCENNVTPDAGFKTSFEADVQYGGMSASYEEK